MLGTSSLKAALADGFIKVYSCTLANIPASADAAITGDHTLLLTVYGDGIITPAISVLSAVEGLALLDAKLAHASATIELLVSIGRVPQ